MGPVLAGGVLFVLLVRLAILCAEPPRAAALLGTTDSFSTPSSRVCTALSPLYNPQHETRWSVLPLRLRFVSWRDTAHPRKFGALPFISGSFFRTQKLPGNRSQAVFVREM